MATRIRKNMAANGSKRLTRQSAAAQNDGQSGESSSELSSGGSDAEDVAESDEDTEAELLSDVGSNVDISDSALDSEDEDEDSDEDDDMEEDLEEEEEQCIIQDLARRRSKGSTATKNAAGTKERAHVEAAREGGAGSEGVADEVKDPFPDDASGSLSPETLHQLGLDELFEGPNGFQSSSEPSFTDFFDSDSEDGTEDGIDLDARSDDQQLTTDDEDSGSDISLLDDEALMNSTFFGDALAAGASTQLAPGAEDLPQNPDIPLLVIEDLDGRLIYARAGDGEAVFGSDGEFEFVDDSEDESDYYNSDVEDFDEDAIYNGTAVHGSAQGWKHARTFDDDDETDEGDTTDELPNEDMPFPRLLVGSVAPRGGRNARRARALAARSRRLASRRQSSSKPRKSSGASNMEPPNGALLSAGAAKGIHDVDFSISTEDLARDPQATLEAAAATLGLTVNEVAQLVIGINTAEDGNVVQGPPSANATPVMNNGLALPMFTTPEHRRMVAPPQMGSFLPTSSKSIHRAFIDGANQAPSPFTARYGTQRKGLAGRKRQLSTPTSSSKRLRHQRSRTADNQMSSALLGNGDDLLAPASSGNDGEESQEGDEMGLDDVMDAALLWRGAHSSSPPPMPPPIGDDKLSGGKKSPSVKAAGQARSPASKAAAAKDVGGLNLNAVARWHRIPMAAFREGQVTGSHHHQPLGTFLLARAQKGQDGKGRTSHLNGARNDHSPFRGRARGASIHLNEAPKVFSGDAFMVSPVLWPTRSGGTNSPASKPSRDSYPMTNGSGTQRKMTTRRVKRERRARKAALKSALSAGVFQDAGSTISATQSPVPEGFMPELDFTGPSPDDSSPGGAEAHDSDNGAVQDAGEQGRPNLSSSGSFAPLSDHALIQHNIQNNTTGLTNPAPSSSLPSHHQPPSSVYGMPLHSPLFGSILNPTNLGFRDDLDDRDDEGVLAI